MGGLSKTQLALSLASGFANSAINNRNTNRQSREDREFAREKLDREERLARDLQTQKLSFEESQEDPFRNFVSQVLLAKMLDELATVQPLSIDPTGGKIGKYTVPSATGGFANWTPSPELQAALTEARTRALQGDGQAPSVINPGATAPTTGMPNARTGVLNLLAGRSASGAPVNTTMPVREGVRPSRAQLDIDQLPMAISATGAPNDFRLSIDDMLMAQPAPRRRRPMMRRAA